MRYGWYAVLLQVTESSFELSCILKNLNTSPVQLEYRDKSNKRSVQIKRFYWVGGISGDAVMQPSSSSASPMHYMGRGVLEMRKVWWLVLIVVKLVNSSNAQVYEKMDTESLSFSQGCTSDGDHLHVHLHLLHLLPHFIVFHFPFPMFIFPFPMFMFLFLICTPPGEGNTWMGEGNMGNMGKGNTRLGENRFDCLNNPQHTYYSTN
jgi:hypothetical protein